MCCSTCWPIFLGRLGLAFMRHVIVRDADNGIRESVKSHWCFSTCLRMMRAPEGEGFGIRRMPLKYADWNQGVNACG